jgi:uncharacterized protein (DUF2336 family)
MNLSQRDVEILGRQPSAIVRADIAGKISHSFAEGEFNEQEQQIALDIFRMLAMDVEIRVRKALSEGLCRAHGLPASVVMPLAADVDEVALPMLEFSPCLSDEELITLIQPEMGRARLSAIARREKLGEALTGRLLEATQDIQVLEPLFSNRGATLPEGRLLATLSGFRRENPLLEVLAQRSDLPLSVVEELYFRVSQEMKPALQQRYRLHDEETEALLAHAQEDATVAAASARNEEREVEALVRALHQRQRLTPSLIVRSLCAGDLTFFEHAIARTVQIPVANARLLLHDPGALGFRAVYQAAGLPEGFTEAVRTLLQLVADERRACGDYPALLGKRMVERILSGGYDRSVENMSFLLALIGTNMQGSTPLH